MNLKKILSVIIAATVTMLNCSGIFAYTDIDENENVPETDISKNENVLEQYIIKGDPAFISEIDENADDGDNVALFGETQVFDGGSGTENDPFLISTEDQLILINDFPSLCFKLKGNIELTYKWNYIGYNGDNFSGILDGNGYVISGLTSIFAGTNEGTIKNTGFKTADGSSADKAVIADSNSGTIENCYAEGNVSSSGGSSDYIYAAGFVCYNTGTIKNCYTNVNVSASNSRYSFYAYAAGFVYENKGTIENCYAKGSVSSSNNLGFICSNNGTIKSCYYDKQVSGCSDTKDEIYSINTLAMKMKETYIDYDFTNVWSLDANINDGYPYLRVNYPNGGSNPVLVFNGGTGTEEDPFLISTSEQLILLNDFPSYSFKLTNEIEVASWEPVDIFSGIFDGGGYGIRGLTKTFILTNEGTIKNCYIEGNVTTTKTSYNYGDSNSYAAGFVYTNKGTIENCYIEGSVTTTDSLYVYAAGFVYTNSGIIKNCYTTENVTATSATSDAYFNNAYAAGFVYTNSGIIENCYTKGNVTTTSDDASYSVGFVHINTGTIESCYSASIITSNTSRNGDKYKYGFIRKNDSGSIKNCYYDRQVSGCTDTTGGSEPKNTLALKMKATYTYWDFDSVWGLDSDINDGYPYLLSESEKIIVENITLDKTSGTLLIGDTVKLTPDIIGVNTDKIKLTWSSSDTNIASVSEGLVIAKTVGKAVITVSCGKQSAEYNLTVSDGSIKITDFKLDQSEISLNINDTLKLNAIITPEDATNKNVKWSSGNPKVAEVSADGTVKAVSAGSTKISAVSEENPEYKAECKVTVSVQKIAVTGITLDVNGSFNLGVGDNVSLTAAVMPSNATNKTIEWTSSNPKAATVVNGVVTGVANGTSTITAITADGGFKAAVTVNVGSGGSTNPSNPSNPSKTPDPSNSSGTNGIALDETDITITVKTRKTLKTLLVPSNADDIKFESTNNAVATVSSTGVVTGISPGNAVIKAIAETDSGRYVAFCTVKVVKAVVDVTSIKFDKGNLSLVQGKTVPLKAIIKPADATYKDIVWTTADESVASVSQDGYVTAVGVGETVISATMKNNNSKYVNCAVTVLSSDTPAQLTVEDATVKAGKDITITVSIASNPGISTFNFDLKYDSEKLYPISYTKGSALSNVNIITPLGSQSYENRDSVRFLCMTSDSTDMDTDGELVTVVFRIRAGIEYGNETIEIIPSGFVNQFSENVKLQQNDCTLTITDYTIGDVNNDDKIDLKDSMLLAQYIAGFDVELSEQGKKAAIAIYPDNDEDNPEPSLNDFQHLFRYLSDWQVELGKK